VPELSSYATGTPCWVDVSSTDLDRSVDFYTGLFGWEAQRDPRPEAGGYTMFTLRGKYVAAASPVWQEGMPSVWTTYIASDDVDATAAKARAAGGNVMMEPFDVLDAGRMTVVQDPTGAVFGVWQAGRHHGSELANEPGSFNWNELNTRDLAAAMRFYEAVFGVEVELQDLGGSEYGVVKVDGRGVAGMRHLEAPEDQVPAHWQTVFAVDDCERALARAEELGGQKLMEPMDVPSIGRFALVQDPVGATFQVIALAPASSS
jgi:predicted enzyme related to lactoylglutathione lyase